MLFFLTFVKKLVKNASIVDGNNFCIHIWPWPIVEQSLGHSYVTV